MKLKSTIAILGLAFIVAGCASQRAVEPGTTFDRVVEAPGYSRDQIYTETKIWIAENFKSAKAVIEMDSKENGLIIGNGAIPDPAHGGSTVAFTMRVDMKDQKFKITFSNLHLHVPETFISGSVTLPGYDGPPTVKGMVSIKPALLKFGDEMLASMNSSKGKDNW